MDGIAKAIARNYGWTIVPCGDTALNMLGLSTQVPSVWHYVSDGPYKTYEVYGRILKFKHTDNKNEIISISYKAALVVQALKALGKDNVTDKDLRAIATTVKKKEKRLMLKETMRVTEDWKGLIINEYLATKKYEVFISSTTAEEMQKCQEPKRSNMVVRLSEIVFQTLPETDEIKELADEYIRGGVLTQKNFDDCMHIAFAVASNCDIIVSWNFKHLVNFRTINKVKVVNAINHYKEISIISPTMLLEEEV